MTTATHTPRAIIVGASSGIGEALARQLAAAGWSVGVAARREERLAKLAVELSSRHPGRTVIHRALDLHDVDRAVERFDRLVADLGGVELVVISSGVGHENPCLAWPPEEETVAVNVAGFTAIAVAAMRHFEARRSGHLVGLSSLAALHGHGDAPAYGASKAFVSRYLQALRHRAASRKLPIVITDIQAGFVDTAMAKGEGLFWVAPVETAARQIVAAIRRKCSHAYVTRRWRIVAWMLRILPGTC
jgi:short-subunit dehydrogenase